MGLVNWVNEFGLFLTGLPSEHTLSCLMNSRFFPSIYSG